jgi:hypothetical protein
MIFAFLFEQILDSNATVCELTNHRDFGENFTSDLGWKIDFSPRWINKEDEEEEHYRKTWQKLQQIPEE